MPQDDPYRWLEDVDSQRALDWVTKQNAGAAAQLAQSAEFERVESRIKAVLDSKDKIPFVTKIGDFYYNFWTDADHERGLWRRTSLASYRTDSPVWETVLDIDELNKVEGENWVWHGATVLREPDGQRRYALVHLSRGGADADVSREFDLVAKDWVADGFYRPEAKGGLSWVDRDTVYVYTDFGPGSLTESGYPRLVKKWRRGTDLADAELVFAGEPTDMYISARFDNTPGYERSFVTRSIAFYDAEFFVVDGEALVPIEVPRSAEIQVHRQWLLVELRDDWQVADRSHIAGSLLAIQFDAFMAGSRDFQTLYQPTAESSLVGAAWTRSHLVLNILHDVKNRLEVWTPGADGQFTQQPHLQIPADGGLGTVAVSAVERNESDQVWLITTDFLTPTTLSVLELGEAPQPLKALPAFFDAEGLVSEQRFATSDDGTKVPYFLISAGGRDRTEAAPTLLYGYGGFEISLTPSYSGQLGSGWLERGGVYALANIRGGGEYGPAWHQAALRENRHRAYEDFAAVARDLIATGVTTPQRLGIQGGSNGGLLTGNMLVKYPELFGAVVIQVPLLDMRRYTKLLAGASWISEYGDPDDPAQWEFIKTFSPYHLLEPGVEYPPVLFTTSTRDDRVHPGHARKMAAAMLDAGHRVVYYENIEGGHGGAATNAQAAHMAALAYEFLWRNLAN